MPDIVYEQPLNERLRFFLRLEFLFQQARHSLHNKSLWDTQNTISALLEILAVLGRIDIKTEVIKELDRISATLNGLIQSPGINHNTLEQLLTTLATFKSQLHAKEGPIAQDLKENELLQLLIQRSANPGGLCDFDLPAYRYWLHRPHEERIDDLTLWLSSLDSLRLSIELMLKLIRESTEPSAQSAENGNFQCSLDAETPYQLIRIMLPVDSPYFVEISAGKHRFTARFLEAANAARPVQTSNNVDFHLCSCAL